MHIHLKEASARNVGFQMPGKVENAWLRMVLWCQLKPLRTMIGAQPAELVIEETHDSLIIDLLISFCFHDISVLFILLSFIFTKRDTAMFKCRFTNKKRFIFRSMQVWHNRVILSRHVVSARSSNEILDLYEYFPCCCKRRKHGLWLVLYYLIGCWMSD